MTKRHRMNWQMSLFVLAFLVAGCATPYQEGNKWTLLGGVSATKITENTYSITVYANISTSAGRIIDYTLLKAAEICIENNFVAFASLSDSPTPQPWVGITKMFKADEPKPANAVNCKTIYQSLAPKYIK